MLHSSENKILKEKFMENEPQNETNNKKYYNSFLKPVEHTALEKNKYNSKI